MIQWTESLLKTEGYNIENAIIEDVDLSMGDHDFLALRIKLRGQSWGCVYGGYVIGKGYLDAKEFRGYADGIESVMRIMDAVGSSSLKCMVGKYVRIATKHILSDDGCNADDDASFSVYYRKLLK